jgi:LysM repeat protein
MVKLLKEHVDLNEMTKKETTQIVKERDLIVPDGKPDMQKVLQLEGEVNIDQIDVQSDRIVYKGQVDITILYQSENNSDTIYTMKGTIPLEDFIILEGVSPDQKISFDYKVEHLHWNILNERKINVKVIIGLSVAATKGKEIVLVSGIESDEPVQVQTSQIEIMQPSAEKEEKVIVKDELTITPNKPSIGEILKMDVSIVEDQVKRTESEILFNGIVEINTMYKAQEDNGLIEVVNHRIPFSGACEVLKSDNEVYWGCDLEVTPTYTQVNPDYDGEDRIIEVECIVTATYNTVDKVVQTILDDLYCPDKKVEVESEEEDYMSLVTRLTSTVPKKEMIPLNRTNLENAQCYGINIKPIIDEKVLQGDKLTISGMLEVKLNFVTPEGANKIDTVVAMVPFSQEMNAPDVTKKDYIVPKVSVKDIKLLSQNKQDVVVEYVLEYVVDVFRKGQLVTIQNVNLVDMDKEELNKYPSIIVYVVKKGDTLWQIAKRFNTTVKDIMEINGLEDANKIMPGQKIIILKKK